MTVHIIPAVLGIVVIVVAVLSYPDAFGGNYMIVGKDIKKEDISEFYFTYDASTYPPYFQRYRFYTEDGKCFFYHEKREGDHWPLLESDIAISGKKELSEEEWNRFFDLLKDGKVEKRTESVEDGDSGPWLYLYWKKDRGKYQEFSFASYGKQKEFEGYCKELAE